MVQIKRKCSKIQAFRVFRHNVVILWCGHVRYGLSRYYTDQLVLLRDVTDCCNITQINWCCCATSRTVAILHRSTGVVARHHGLSRYYTDQQVLFTQHAVTHHEMAATRAWQSTAILKCNLLRISGGFDGILVLEIIQNMYYCSIAHLECIPLRNWYCMFVHETFKIMTSNH